MQSKTNATISLITGFLLSLIGGLVLCFLVTNCLMGKFSWQIDFIGVAIGGILCLPFLKRYFWRCFFATVLFGAFCVACIRLTGGIPGDVLDLLGHHGSLFLLMGLMGSISLLSALMLLYGLRRLLSVFSFGILREKIIGSAFMSILVASIVAAGAHIYFSEKNVQSRKTRNAMPYAYKGDEYQRNAEYMKAVAEYINAINVDQECAWAYRGIETCKRAWINAYTAQHTEMDAYAKFSEEFERLAKKSEDQFVLEKSPIFYLRQKTSGLPGVSETTVVERDCEYSFLVYYSKENINDVRAIEKAVTDIAGFAKKASPKTKRFEISIEVSPEFKVVNNEYQGNDKTAYNRYHYIFENFVLTYKAYIPAGKRVYELMPNSVEVDNFREDREDIISDYTHKN